MTATPTDTPSLYTVTGVQQNTCDLPPEFPAEPLPLPIKGYAVAHPGALVVFHVVLMTSLWNVPYVAVCPIRRRGGYRDPHGVLAPSSPAT